MEPAVSHLLKNAENSKEVTEILGGSALDTYDYVLAPVNNRVNDEEEGGGHWSLLLYTRDTDTYHHLDSLEPHNQRHAEQLAARLSGDPCVSVVCLRCCRQKFSVECGAYVLHFADIICSMIRNNMSVHDDRCYSQQFSVNAIYDSIKKVKNSNRKDDQQVKHKIILLSDSHGRGLRHLVQEKVKCESEVFSMVKPNATLENVTSGLNGEISKLGSSDHLVILGGTNNVNTENEYNVRCCVKEIALKTMHTNVIICTVPLRYDRPDLNCKIRKINIDLIIEALKYDHISVVSISNIPVRDYTYHGLHLSKWGKVRLSHIIVNKINGFNLN